ncbi:MAG: carboxypeptidase regulatory-like domain-containing protein, partial [Gemmatimonadota bacterium]
IITGRVTDASTGLSLPNIIILAEGDVGGEDYYFTQALTDENGDYSVGVEPGTWQVVAVDYIQNEYQSSDTLAVTVGEGETKTLNFQLQKYTSFVEGYTKKQDGTPVPGIEVIAYTLSSFKISLGNSNEQGYYKLGVDPGQVVVSTLLAATSQDPDWPAGYYADPGTDTVTVTAGQTVQVDFIFKPYSAFIEGDCWVDQTGLAGVEITAMSMDFQTFEFHISFAVSNAQGHYRIGVMPGTVSMLTASRDGYDMTSPLGGYMGLTIAQGQTITGKDFTFESISGEMSISGRVTYEAGGAASNVYVVAVLDMENSPAGYLITSTDGSGNYRFDGLMEGDWTVGVYKEGYGSTPAMIYEFLWPGVEITDADFILQASTGVVKGDVNDDGEIDLFDLLLIVNHILETETLDPDGVTKADCNNDGAIDLLDLLGIVNVILGTGACEPGACGKIVSFSRKHLGKMYSRGTGLRNQALLNKHKFQPR